MSRGPDIRTLLVRALHRLSCAAGCPIEIVDAQSVRWASATFAGARHMMVWHAVPSPALDAWLAALPEAEIALHGHLLADIAVTAVTRATGTARIEIEALTVTDG